TSEEWKTDTSTFHLLCLFEWCFGTLVEVDELIRDNLAEKKARHLMLLTKNNAAL
ncbi:unnamed protein product, partial [Choristocarpus tenellus]